MADALVTTSTPTDGVAVLAFNRPSKRNALSQDLIDQLIQGLTAAAQDASVRVIVLTGSNTFFSAGADIKEIAQLDAEAARQRRYLEDLCKCVGEARKPVLAAVEGMALGGGFEVALMCDIIFASTTARFGLPEVSIGLLPGAGGTQRLTNVVGKFKAMQVVLLGKQLEAAEAHAAGLVAELYQPGTVLECTLKVAAQLAASSPTAVALSKEAIKRADDLGRDDEFERSLYYFAFGTADKREGVQAFLEKRAPSWSTGSEDR